MTNNSIRTATGMTFFDDQGNQTVDLIAGLASCLGHRHPAVLAAIKSACDADLGACHPLSAYPPHPYPPHPNPLPRITWGEGAFDAFSNRQLTASANEANELALRIARSTFGGEKYRVITLLGSDHGDTFALRSASGRPEGQGFDGPVAAGYRHVMPGDMAALTKAIDDKTAAVYLAPVDWNRGGEPLDSEYLVAVETLCREHELLLVLDETRIPPGVGGTWFFHQRGGIAPDIVTAAAGWTGGLPGGIVLSHDPANHHAADRLPLLQAIVNATERTVINEKLLAKIVETADTWAAMLDEIVSGFDFVRGCVHAGLWTTIELDLPAVDVANSAIAAGLRLQVSGETQLLICPPINVSGDRLLESMEPLRHALELIERETVSS